MGDKASNEHAHQSRRFANEKKEEEEKGFSGERLGQRTTISPISSREDVLFHQKSLRSSESEIANPCVRISRKLEGFCSSHSTIHLKIFPLKFPFIVELSNLLVLLDLMSLHWALRS